MSRKPVTVNSFAASSVPEASALHLGAVSITRRTWSGLPVPRKRRARRPSRSGQRPFASAANDRGAADGTEHAWAAVGERDPFTAHGALLSLEAGSRDLPLVAGCLPGVL